jgi:hypothetical protein
MTPKSYTLFNNWNFVIREVYIIIRIIIVNLSFILKSDTLLRLDIDVDWGHSHRVTTPSHLGL